LSWRRPDAQPAAAARVCGERHTGHEPQDSVGLYVVLEAALLGLEVPSRSAGSAGFARCPNFLQCQAASATQSRASVRDRPRRLPQFDLVAVRIEEPAEAAEFRLLDLTRDLPTSLRDQGEHTI